MINRKGKSITILSFARIRAKNTLRLATVFLSCLIALALSVDTVADKSQQAELDQLKRSISSLEKELQNQRQEKDDIQQQLQGIELQAAKVNRNIRLLRNKIARTEKQLSDLNKKQQQLEKRIVDQRSAIAEQIRSIYKTGSEEPVKLLLNQENPQKIARIFKYYEYLLEARSKKIQQFKTTIDELEKTIAQINKVKIDLANSQKDLQTDRKALIKTTKRRQQMLNRLENELLSGEQKLVNLQRERKALEKLINRVQRAAAKIAPAKDYPSFASSKGKLIWPVKGKLAHSFKSQRGNYLRWEGWLINTQAGTEVQAIHHGRVVFSNYLRGFGLLIIVDHGDGFMSLYAHNQELLREAGDWVQSGEIVSRAGNTGGLNKPALYFEIREKGVPVNPKIWLSKHYTSP
jgi:septal ring factor EnvC (AmiA/AmiB activator)